MGDMKAAPGSDRSLVVEFQRGEDSAFDEIFKRYQARVSGICYRMLGSPQDAEEATQETFLKAYQALGRFNGNYYLGAWLGRIATNVCLDQLRARSRTNLVALPEEREDLVTEEGPEDVVVGDHPRLQQAIKEVQPLHASALALRALEGMSHQEIAGRLDMSPAQVKALLHRARSSLRRAWDKAEGWAVVAPLALRRLTSARGTADASKLLPISPSAVPYLMEKVAASAMIVAAALGGLPSGDPAPGDVRIPAVAERGISVSAPATGTASERTPEAGTTSTEDSPIEATDPEPELTETAEALIAEVDKTLKGAKKASPPAPPEEDENDEGPLGPHAAQGEQAMKKAQKVVRDVQESLPPN